MKNINEFYYNKIYNVITSYAPKRDKNKEICQTFSSKLIDSDDKYLYFNDGDCPLIVLKEAVVTMLCLKSNDEFKSKFKSGDKVKITKTGDIGYVREVLFDMLYKYKYIIFNETQCKNATICENDLEEV